MMKYFGKSNDQRCYNNLRFDSYVEGETMSLLITQYPCVDMTAI